jgi:hypothetical protein
VLLFIGFLPVPSILDHFAQRADGVEMVPVADLLHPGFTRNWS